MPPRVDTDAIAAAASGGTNPERARPDRLAIWRSHVQTLWSLLQGCSTFKELHWYKPILSCVDDTFTTSIKQACSTHQDTVSTLLDTQLLKLLLQCCSRGLQLLAAHTAAVAAAATGDAAVAGPSHSCATAALPDKEDLEVMSTIAFTAMDSLRSVMQGPACDPSTLAKLVRVIEASGKHLTAFTTW
jgi:hypothetical protein